MSQPEVSPESELTDLAEQALLGAVLWDPRRLSAVDWLRPDDFYRPIHQGIFETWTLLAQHDRAQLPQLLTELRHHEVRTGTAINVGVVIADLLAATPAAPTSQPPNPDQSPAVPVEQAQHVQYARLVLEASVRREVRAMGCRIDQAAEASAPAQPQSPLIATESVAEALTRQIEQAATRLSDLTERLIAARDPAPGPGVGSSVPSVPVTVTRYRDQARAEGALIGACLVYPAVRELAVGRLRPDDLSTPEAARSWTSIVALHSSGASVDFVLVAAHQHRDSAHVATPALRPTDLARLAQRADISSGYYALASVTHSALVRAADRSNRLLDALAADPALSTEALLSTTRGALAQLGGDIRRLAADSIQPRARTPAPRPPMANPAPLHTRAKPITAGLTVTPAPPHGRVRGR